MTRLALLADADVGVRRSKQVIGSDVPRLLEPPSARLGRVARGTPGGLGGGQSAGRGGGGHSMGLWVYWIGHEGRDASLQLACELDRLALGHARASLLR